MKNRARAIGYWKKQPSIQPHDIAVLGSNNGEHQWWWGGDVEIGFNRPYGKYCQIVDAPLSTGSGEWFLWEYPFAYWLEAQGFDVTYISNLDTHTDPAGLCRAKGFLSVGHDEYWSIEMFRNVQAALDCGVNLGFFPATPVAAGSVFPRISKVALTVFSSE